MGKKKKKKKPGTPPLTAKDRHHILFPKNQEWSKGYAKLLCQSFIRPVPVVSHRELHTKLHFVPLPPAELLHKAWNKYQMDKEVIDGYDVARAASWLYVNIPDEAFREAMQFQIDFFTTRLG